MRFEVAIDWRWADGHMKAIADVLAQNAMHLLGVQAASEKEDLEQATDLVITVQNGSVAVRIRRPVYYGQYRDLTIRAWRASDIKTELDKIREGFGDWYLYGWSNGRGGLADWILVDLHKLRGSGLLESKPVIPNRDGRTGFVAISADELDLHGCLVSQAERTELSDAVVVLPCKDTQVLDTVMRSITGYITDSAWPERWKEYHEQRNNEDC